MGKKVIMSGGSHTKSSASPSPPPQPVPSVPIHVPMHISPELTFQMARTFEEIMSKEIVKQHRNKLCNCGSGKKYKKCCKIEDGRFTQDLVYGDKLVELRDEAIDEHRKEMDKKDGKKD